MSANGDGDRLRQALDEVTQLPIRQTTDELEALRVKAFTEISDLIADEEDRAHLAFLLGTIVGLSEVIGMRRARGET